MKSFHGMHHTLKLQGRSRLWWTHKNLSNLVIVQNLVALGLHAMKGVIMHMCIVFLFLVTCKWCHHPSSTMRH